MQLLSWNVNGLRALAKKGFLKWFEEKEPDILCFQETKAWEEQLPPEIRQIDGYFSFFSQAERKGYSGVALYTRLEPKEVSYSFADGSFDNEGRVIVARYPDFTLYNVYFPNGKASRERLEYKMNFYHSFLNHLQPYIKEGERIIVCGDVNTAHREIDLARPRENEKTSGFLPEERQWIDRFIKTGFHDTFRLFNSQGGNYSWWDLKTRARERNVGWRIDYVFVSENIKEAVKDAFILPEVQGSDHCPTGVEMDIEYPTKEL